MALSARRSGRSRPGFEIRPVVRPSPALTSDRDHQFTLADLYPAIEAAAAKQRLDPKIIAAIAYQESGFKNWLVHRDGTGHGLFGLDDNGLLPEFERWAGLIVGRGAQALSIPPGAQIEYVAWRINLSTVVYGDVWAAVRAWHRGGALRDDARGLNYEALIRAHTARLFPQ